MSDSIQSIGFVPQINKLSPNKRTGDKKGKKENKKDFAEHMSDSDEDVKGKARNQAREDSENTEHKKQIGENSLHENKDDDFDNGCGSLLDTEL